MGSVRLIARLASLIVALLAGLALHGTWRLVGAASPWPLIFLGTAGRIVGARRRVIGRPMTRDVLFVSNHLSWIDILVLAGTSGSTFVAKSELRGVPLIGWLCTLNRTIFVERGQRMGVTGQIGQVRNALTRGQAVTIFPEGTTGDGETLLPFKAALLAVLDPPLPGVQVQPVRIDYGDATRELAWIGDEPGHAHAARVLRRAGSFTVTMRFLDPFDPAEFTGRKAIAAEARRRIEASREA